MSLSVCWYLLSICSEHVCNRATRPCPFEHPHFIFQLLRWFSSLLCEAADDKKGDYGKGSESAVTPTMSWQHAFYVRHLKQVSHKVPLFTVMTVLPWAHLLGNLLLLDATCTARCTWRQKKKAWSREREQGRARRASGASLKVNAGQREWQNMWEVLESCGLQGQENK